MTFSIVNDAQNWAEEIKNYQHDFYHTWDFHHISANNGEGQPILFKYSEGGDCVCYPLLEREISGVNNYKDLNSVYGYPGPLFSTDNIAVQNHLLNQLLLEIGNLNYVSLFSRLHPIINGSSLTCSLPVGDVVYFDLSKDLAKIFSQMRRCHKQDIVKLKQSELVLKKQQIVTHESITQFKQIYHATMDELQAKDYYYFDNNYYHGFFQSSQFNTSLYTIYLDDIAIASAITANTSSFSQYHLCGTLPEFYQQKAMKLILFSAMEDMHHLGLKYFILGGGVGAQKDSLYDFKYGFGRNTAPFNVIKKIFNTSLYNKLVDARFKNLNLSPEEDISYFPLYQYTH